MTRDVIDRIQTILDDDPSVEPITEDGDVVVEGDEDAMLVSFRSDHG